MNRQKSIAVFAVIAAVAMTSIGLTAMSSTSFMILSSPSRTPELVGMLGHVEYTVRDSANFVTSYMQGDNVVVDAGKDCAGSLIFGASVTGDCDAANSYQYVAIGNVTGGIGAATHSSFRHMNTTAAGDSESCAFNTQDGEMARKLITPTITTVANAQGSQGTVVELDTSGSPFEFGSDNATDVEQSAIFNGAITTTAADGSCEASGTAGTTWSMFSIQDLNSGAGITVTDGDSLSVKWTITIG